MMPVPIGLMTVAIAVAHFSIVLLQKVLLCVGTTLCNFLMTAFFR